MRYADIKLGSHETDSLSFTIEPKAIGLVIDRDIPQEYQASEVSPFRMVFDATVTPASPLGRLSGLGKMRFPVLLHFPDWGSLLIRAQEHGGEESTWDFSLFRDLKPFAAGAVATWGPMTPEERKKVEKIGNRKALQQGTTHIAPEQIQLALHKGFGQASNTPENNASNWA